MSVSAALIWDPSFVSYRFKPNHPFNPKRLELTVSLIEEMGLLSAPDVKLVKPRQATQEELLRVHDANFVAAVKRLGSEEGIDNTEGWPWGLGTDDNPIFPGMHEATSYVVGGTIQSAQMVMSGEVRRAFNVAGGAAPWSPRPRLGVLHLRRSGGGDRLDPRNPQRSCALYRLRCTSW